ncbi:protein trapped in endoderm-1 [Copidosoma floridanum]|uniref:protein trapped in endoderm-1 n=1 Tax=Copidosoma floridanum TaxID=29053 RepID=UPI000C6FA181|nr:protein trapped in endoderm-1 [Copidosoma floridanum]
MVAITINRYVLISRADIYPRIYTPRGICLMLVAVWTISFSLLIPPLLGIWGELGLDESSFSCTILKKNNRSPKKLLFVVGFLLPCLVIIFSYLCIYWRVRKSRRNIKAHMSQGAGQRKSGFVKREDSRVTWLMLTIFLCYLLCYMPLMLANCLEDQVKVPTVHVLASVLAWASAVINPFIYTGTNKLYREAYRQLLCPKRNKVKMGSPVTNPKILNSHSSKVSSQPT